MKNITKTIVVFIAILTVTFSGCGLRRVEYIGNTSIQTSDDEKELYLFFALLDGNKKEMSADGSVDIRIDNNDGETVFSKKYDYTSKDFSTYSNVFKGEMYLCRVAVSVSEIKPGTTSEGTIYYKVYKENEYEFEEMSDDLDFELQLPIAEAKLNIKNELPVELSSKGYKDEIETKVKITDIRCEIDKYSGTSMTIFFNGEKTFDCEGESSTEECRFNYKITDKDGFVIDSGFVFTNNLKVGEKFKDESENIYEIKPGEEYYLELYDYD